MVDSDGEQLGVMKIKDALEKANNRELDLVEVAPNAKPPVCKKMDFGKYKYQLGKRQHTKSASTLKEIKVRPRIDKHDLERKVRHMIAFLDEGHKTKVSMFFRGRERARPDLGMKVFDELIVMLDGKYNILNQPKYEGNSINMVVSPSSHK